MALSEQEFNSLQGDPELGRSLGSASRRDPGVAAEALKTPFSDDYYQQNKSAIQNEAKLTAIDTAEISNKSPKTANYLKNQNNAAVSSDDLHVLRGMEAVITEHDKGFWGRRWDDARRGFATLRRSGDVLGVQTDTSMAEHIALIDEAGVTNFDDYVRARIDRGLKVGTPPQPVLDYLKADQSKKQAIKQRVSKSLIGGVIDIAERSKEIEAIPRSRAAEKFAMSQSFNEAIGAVAENPLEVISGITTESFVQFAPAIPLAMAGGPVAMLGVGGTSFLGEYTNDMVGSMQESGIDVQSPDELKAAFEDPEKMAAWKEHAVAKGVPIAMFDALSMGVAGKFVSRAATRPGKAAAGAGEALVMQPALGAAGEAAGQLTAGDELSGKDILAEALGEILPGTAETVAGSYTHYRDSVKEAKVRKIEKTVNSLVEQSTLDKVISYAQGSATNQRDQTRFEEFINTLGEDKTVLIPADIAAEIEDAPIYLKANEGGPDISVPLSKFATEIATNEAWMSVLRPHIKLSEGGMSQNEMQTDDNSDLKSLLDKAQNAQETLTEAEQVFETVKDQLVATGMQSEETARFSAQLYPAAATVFAEKAKKMGHDVSVAEVFDMMGFSVEAGKPATVEDEVPRGTIIDQIFEQDLIPADLEISMESEVIETGETVTETFNAKELNQAIDSKVESYNVFKDCLG